ncbi:MAG: hypothetical protein GX483_04270 [Actinomycetaceae bacterium]|nr:hypothetical protein [Actinomycetaceae bacterium]
MSAMPLHVSRAPQSRPVIEAPGLQVVPTPAPARGFFMTVLICALLFIGSLGGAFHLNTLMVAGAYELKDINVEYREAVAREATLTSEVIKVSTPTELKAAAEELGMAPATSMVHIDLTTGVITDPNAGE